MLLIMIEGPHFVAGYDVDSGNIAPIIRYMRGWTIEEIIRYCEKKGWKFNYDLFDTGTV